MRAARGALLALVLCVSAAAAGRPAKGGKTGADILPDPNDGYSGELARAWLECWCWPGFATCRLAQLPQRQWMPSCRLCLPAFAPSSFFRRELELGHLVRGAAPLQGPQVPARLLVPGESMGRDERQQLCGRTQPAAVNCNGWARSHILAAGNCCRRCPRSRAPRCCWCTAAVSAQL